jgi:muramoyltetrapeptide carboxypeptidase
MSQFTPNYLKKGDTVGIVSPARHINKKQVEPTIAWLEKYELKVQLGPNMFNILDQMAGSDSDKISDFQGFIDDPNIQAILCSRGGYGSVRILDQINFQPIIDQKKWILGYSDVTAIHSHIQANYGFPTLHCTMPINITGSDDLQETASKQSLIDALFGKDLSYHLPNNSLNRYGEASGRLIGGNLSMLYSLCGSKSDISTDGSILFLEDLDEYLYHIDRMMMNLKRTGKLHTLSALIVGGMSDMNDNPIPFGKDALQIISDHTKDYDYPVYFGLDAGHTHPNLSLRLGMNAHIRDNTLFLPA